MDENAVVTVADYCHEQKVWSMDGGAVINALIDSEDVQPWAATSPTGCRCLNCRRRCRGMSERQEHRQRLNARIAYAAAIERWAKNQPSRIRFFAVRRWLKEMPRKEDFYAVD